MKKIHFSDIMIIIVLCLFVTAIMVISFTVKSVKYEQNSGLVKLNVQKKEFTINAQTTGILADSKISVGQHVKKGDIVGSLTNETLDQQIAVLSGLKDNASAIVQLSQLQAQKASQTLYSPTDGVVASAAAQGEAINNSQKVASIYSDDAVQLLGRFDYTSYTLFQQNTSNLKVTSLRDNQEYPVNYGGTLQEISTDENKKSLVTLFFTFASPNDAINALQNEEMVIKIVKDNGAQKPIDKLVELFKGSIFNTQ